MPFNKIAILILTLIVLSCSKPDKEPIHEGKFEPTCESEAGDRYARHLYVESHWQSTVHRAKYGHPSEFGFKDVINEWKADKWNPEELLVAMYKRAGAKYFFAIVEDITACMDINSETIYGTRPWIIYGEGPSAENANPINAQGFNEGKGDPYSASDIRFTQKEENLYAIVMELPEGNQSISIKSLGTESRYYSENLDQVELLGGNLKGHEFEHEHWSCTSTMIQTL